MASKKIINITGAGSGFGALAARTLAKRGHTVYAGIRNLKTDHAAAQETLDFAAAHKVSLHPIEQDVTSDASIAASISQILSSHAQLDVLVHNAGHMVYGPTEAFTPQQLHDLYEINAVSTQRVNRAVLPHMRKGRDGLVVWVSSGSVHGPTPPWLAPYFAAKAGMDALAASYAAELARWGVETAIVSPGVYTKGTSHFATAGGPGDEEVAREYTEGEGAPYAGVMERVMEGMGEMVPEGAEVQEVADVIAGVVEMEKGTRPFRAWVDPVEDGGEVVSFVRDKYRRDMYKALGLGDLLRPRV